MGIDLNALTLIHQHMSYCDKHGCLVDTDYIREVCDVGMEFFAGHAIEPGLAWHTVRDEWLKDNPVRSGRWG